jgi:ergothioneine biosynthesis protein EgtC
MCRFALYLGPPITLDTLVTKPVNSIIHQSFHSHERTQPLNGDGFGVGWYVPELSPRPAVFRSITPAWNNENLLGLARVTVSGCILAHVRAASPGLSVTETNCHPFSHGRYAFMHNGVVGGFDRVRRALLQSLSDKAFPVVRGTTDSELMFALFLDHHRLLEGHDAADRMAVALEATLQQVVEAVARAGISEDSYLNLAVTDGHRAVASRFTTGAPSGAASLYVHNGKQYVCDDDGVCRMVSPDVGQGAVLVCSEPLSEDAGWERVPPNHLVLVNEDRSVTLRPCVSPPRRLDVSA